MAAQQSPADTGATKSSDAGARPATAKPADASAKPGDAKAAGAKPADASAKPAGGESSAPGTAPKPAEPPAADTSAASAAPVDDATFVAAHASPSVRQFARELGVDLARVTGTGPKGRIQQQDVQGFVKQALSRAPSAAASAGGGVTGGGALNLLPWPVVDFAKYGETEPRPLSRIKKISGANLARNWVMIPTSRNSTKPTSPISRPSVSN
jgi:pyruvate dehydrogenase E2 component (dihydrolipoamide acetyltransferase)